MLPILFLRAALVVPLVSPQMSIMQNVSLEGRYRMTTTNFVLLRFHRVGSLTARMALVNAVGLNRSYAEHKSLAIFNAEGLGGLICQRPAKRVVVAALFRDPVSRLLSALNYVMVAQKHKDVAKSCDDRDSAWFNDRLEEYRQRRNLKYFLADAPYSTVLNVTSEKDVAPALAFLKANFILGLTVKMDSFMGRLTKAFHGDRQASTYYAKKQRFDQIYQGHVAKPYCRKSDLPRSTLTDLNTRVGTDATLYRGIVELNSLQRVQGLKDLPVHHYPSCDPKHHVFGSPLLYLRGGDDFTFALDYSAASQDFSDHPPIGILSSSSSEKAPARFNSDPMAQVQRDLSSDPSVKRHHRHEKPPVLR